MSSYQPALLDIPPFGGTETLGSMRLALWSIWTLGNHYHAVNQVNRIVVQMEKRIRNMAPKALSSPSDVKFYFVNVSVGEDDIPIMDELFPTPDVTFNLLTGMLADGLKVSFALNAHNDMTICSITDRREGSKTAGACLTGGGDGWYDALVVALYKYTHLLQGDLGAGKSSAGQSRRII